MGVATGDHEAADASLALGRARRGIGDPCARTARHDGWPFAPTAIDGASRSDCGIGGP
jgi:hypothetical protein